MGFLEKLKNTFFEEEYVEIEEKVKPKKEVVREVRKSSTDEIKPLIEEEKVRNIRKDEIVHEGIPDKKYDEIRARETESVRRQKVVKEEPVARKNFSYFDEADFVDFNEQRETTPVRVKNESVVGISYIQIKDITKQSMYVSLDEGSYDPINKAYLVREGDNWYAANIVGSEDEEYIIDDVYYFYKNGRFEMAPVEECDLYQTIYESKNGDVVVSSFNKKEHDYVCEKIELGGEINIDKTIENIYKENSKLKENYPVLVKRLEPKKNMD